MVVREEKTILFDPLKPVGLRDPKTGKTLYAVIQLRQDNATFSMYNLADFQTHLKYDEQKRVSSMIPSLENTRPVRYGRMHGSTYMASPDILNTIYEARKQVDLFFAG